MKFIGWKEQVKLIGFNDLKLMLIAIPALSIVFSILVFGFNPLNNSLIDTLSIVGLTIIHILVFWLIDRQIALFFHKRLSQFKDLKKRIIYQSIVVFITTVLLMQLMKQQWICPVKFEEVYNTPFVNIAIASFALTIFILFFYEYRYALDLLKDGLVKNEILSRQNAQAQLESLKNQVNPHFLFNSLNTLISVIPEDPKTAIKFAENLSHVYRHILEIKDKEVITLKEELKCINAYNYLLKIRFGDHIKFEYDNFEILDSKYIVPLSIQILIENAIKHNVVSSSRPLLVKLTLSDNELTVSNNLQLKTLKEKSTKVGLENINKRYHLLINRKIIIEQTKTDYSVRLPIIKMNELK